jgi:hypothetical protein
VSHIRPHIIHSVRFTRQNFLRTSHLSHPCLLPRTFHALNVRILVTFVHDVRMAFSPDCSNFLCLGSEFSSQCYVLKTFSICVHPEVWNYWSNCTNDSGRSDGHSNYQNCVRCSAALFALTNSCELNCGGETPDVGVLVTCLLTEQKHVVSGTMRPQQWRVEGELRATLVLCNFTTRTPHWVLYTPQHVL